MMIVTITMEYDSKFKGYCYEYPGFLFICGNSGGCSVAALQLLRPRRSVMSRLFKLKSRASPGAKFALVGQLNKFR